MFRITGRVVEKESQRALPGLIVKPYDKDWLYEDLLGYAMSDLDGTFEIVYEGKEFQELFEKEPDVYLKVQNADGEDIFSTRKRFRFSEGQEEFTLIKIPLENLPQEIRNKSVDPGSIELVEKLLVPENLRKQRFLWQDIDGAVHEISKIQTPMGEQIFLNVLKIEETIQIAKGSELPGIMSPDDTLKAIAIEHLTVWTGQKYEEEIIGAIAGRESSTLYSRALSYLEK
jgi:hypothetical protein